MSDTGWNIVTPKKRVNTVINPIIGSTNGYSAVSGASLSRDEDTVLFGRYSLKVDSTASGRGVSFTLSGDEATGYKAILFYSTQSSNTVTKVSGTEDTVGVAIDSIWYEHRLNLGTGDLSSSVSITQVGAGSDAWYVDGVQVEQLDGETDIGTTLIHGDIEGAGYQWLGEANNSASRRRSEESSGGYVRSFSEYFGFSIESNIGAAMLPIEVLTDNVANGVGGSLNNIEIKERPFELRGFFKTENGFHVGRGLLSRALHSLSTDTPRRLIYKGAPEWKYIDAFYDGGLEGGDTLQVNHEFLTLRFDAIDPYFYSFGRKSVELGDTYSQNVYGFIGREDGLWTDNTLPDAPLAFTEVDKVEFGSGFVAIGGAFNRYDGNVGVDVFSTYNISTGEYLSSSTGTAITFFYDMIFRNGLFYVGGGGTTATQLINTFDPSNNTWSITPVGSPTVSGANESVRSLAFTKTGDLWIAGSFTNFDGSIDYLAVYDGSSWSQPYTSMTGSLSSVRMTADNSGNVFFVITAPSPTIDGATGRLFRYDADADTYSAVTPTEITLANDLSILYLNGYIYVGSWGASDKAAVARFDADDLGNETVVYSSSISGSNSSVCEGLTVYEGNSILLLGNEQDYVDPSDTATVIGSHRGALIIRNPSTSPRWEPLTVPLLESTPSTSSYYTDYVNTGIGEYLSARDATIVTNYESATIPYTGSAPAFISLRATQSNSGSITIQEFTNAINGSVVKINNYAMTENEELTLSFNQTGILLISSFDGDVSNFIDDSSDSSKFWLIPDQSEASKDNIIAVSYEETGSATLSVLVDFDVTHLGQD